MTSRAATGSGIILLALVAAAFVVVRFSGDSTHPLILSMMAWAAPFVYFLMPPSAFLGLLLLVWGACKLLFDRMRDR